MSLKLVRNKEGLILNSKAQKAIIEALRFQLSAWRAVEPGGDMDEDDFADLQNDIGYLEILLHSLEDDYKSKY